MFDAHTHFIPADVMSWLKENRRNVNAQWEQKLPGQNKFLTVNNKWSFELKEAFIHIDCYLDEQAKGGITQSLLSPVPQLFLYDFGTEITQDLASVYNKALSILIKEHPSRLLALATVPLNDPTKAAEELKSSMDLGLKGAIIGPGIGNRMLTDVEFTPFWEEANAQKAILFIHPLLAEDPRLKRRMLPNLIGVPWETTICAADILLSGLLDTYPHVKILLAHGGGFLPYQIGRLTKGYESWNQVSSALHAPPTEYLKKFWYDNVLWNKASQDYLIETVGYDRIVPGSDFPFDLCTWPPANYHDQAVESLIGLEHSKK